MARVSNKLIMDKLEHLSYCEILYRINKREVTASSLAREMGKAQPTIYEQLNILYEEGYLKRKQKKKENNAVFYSIKWEKITQEFIREIDIIQKENKKVEVKVSKNLNEDLKFILDKQKGISKSARLVWTTKIKKELAQNPLLIDKFKSIFFMSNDLGLYYPIRLMFDMLINSNWNTAHRKDKSERIKIYTLFDKNGDIGCFLRRLETEKIKGDLSPEEVKQAIDYYIILPSILLDLKQSAIIRGFAIYDHPEIDTNNLKKRIENIKEKYENDR